MKLMIRLGELLFLETCMHLITYCNHPIPLTVYIDKTNRDMIFKKQGNLYFH